jgi:hypothetical protein
VKKIFIPQQEWEEVVRREPNGIFMDYDEFLKLKKLAEKNQGRVQGPEAPPPPVAACVESASYTGRLQGDVLVLKGDLRVYSFTDGVAVIPLELSDAALTAATLDGKPAPMAREKGRVSLVLRSRGAHRLACEITVPVKKLASGRELACALPRTPGTVVTVVLPGKQEVNTKPVLSRTRFDEDRSVTEVTASLGTGRWFRMNFREKALESALKPLVFLRRDLDLSVVNGIGIARWALAFRVKREAIRGIDLRVPRDWTLSSLEAPNVLTWSLSDGVIRVRFRSKQEKDFGVRLTMERLVPPGELPVPDAGAEGALRTTGGLRVSLGEDYKAKVVRTRGVRQTDFPGRPRSGAVAFRAYEYAADRPEVVLALSATPTKCRCFVRTAAWMGERETLVKCHLRYMVEEGLLFRLDLGMPPGLVLKDVTGRRGIGFAWNQVKGRILVQFPRPLRRGAVFDLSLSGRMPRIRLEEGRGTASLPVFSSGVDLEEGVIAVGAEGGLVLREEKLEGLDSIDIAREFGPFRICADDLRLAYRYAAQPVSGTVSLEREKAQVNLETTVMYSPLRMDPDAGVDVHAMLDFEILKAAVDQLTFVLPAGTGRRVLIEGARMKDPVWKESPEGEIWTVPLQTRVKGHYRMLVSFSVRLGKGGGLLPTVRGLDTARDSGFVGIEACPNTEVSLRMAEAGANLEEVDTGEIVARKIPGYLPGNRILFGYKYLDPAYRVTLSLVPFEEGAEGDPVVESVHVLSQFGPWEGEKSTAVLSVLNTGAKELRFRLPGKADEVVQLWSVMIDGEGIKPAVAADHYIAPLGASAAPKRLVKIVYFRPKNRVTPLGKFSGSVPEVLGSSKEGEETLKKTVTPVQGSSLSIVMPEGYRLLGTGGSMVPLFDTGESRAILRWFWEKFPGLGILIVFCVFLGVFYVAYTRQVEGLVRILLSPRVARWGIGAASGVGLVCVLILLFSSWSADKMEEAPGMASEIAGTDESNGSGRVRYKKMKSRARRHADLGAIERDVYEEPPIEDPVLKDAEMGEHFETDDEEFEEESVRSELKKKLDNLAGKRLRAKRKAAAEARRPSKKRKESAVQDSLDQVRKLQEQMKRAQSDRDARKQRWKGDVPQREKESAKAEREYADEKAPGRPADRPAPTPMPGAPAEKPGQPRADEGGKGPGGGAGGVYGGRFGGRRNLRGADKAPQSKGGEGFGWGEEDAAPTTGATRGRSADSSAQSGIRVRKKGLRALPIDLHSRGNDYRFRGTGSSGKADLYLMSQGFSRGFSFFLFFAALLVPVVLVLQKRDWMLPAVLIGIAVTHLVPELSPGLSGVMNMAFCGLVAGLLAVVVVTLLGRFRTRVFNAIVPLALVAAVLFPMAAEGAEKPDLENPVRVFVPYDPEKVAETGVRVGRVYVPYDDYIRLWDLAFPGRQAQPKPPQVLFGHSKVTYIGTVDEEWFLGEAIFEVSSYAREPVEIPLGLEGAVVEEVLVNQKKGELRKRRGGYAFVADKPGNYILDVSFRVKGKVEGKVGEFGFGLHPIPCAKATIRFRDAVLEGKVETALGGQVEHKEEKKVVAYLGAAATFRLAVAPRGVTKRAGTSVKAETFNRLLVEQGFTGIEQACTLRVVGRPAEAFRFALDPDLTVVSVTGGSIRVWRVDREGGSKILRIQNQTPVEKEITFRIYAERNDPSGEKFALPLMRPLDVVQEKGVLTVEAGPSLKLGVDEFTNLRPIDATSYRRGLKYAARLAYRFTARPLTFRYTRTGEKEDLHARVLLHSWIAENETKVRVSARIESRQARAFALAAEFPGHLWVRSVSAYDRRGSLVKDWWVEKPSEGPKRLHVLLHRGLRGLAGLVLGFDGPKPGEGMELPFVRLQGFGTQRGALLVQAASGLELESADLRGIRAVDLAAIFPYLYGPQSVSGPPVRQRKRVSIPRPRLSGLAFEYLEPGYAGRVAVKETKPLVSVRWVTHALFGPDAAEFGFYLDFQSSAAPAKTVRFALPAQLDAERIEIECPNLREVVRSDTKIGPRDFHLFEVRLQRGFLGTLRIGVYYQQVYGQVGEEVYIPNLVVPQVEREAGFLLVQRGDATAMLTLGKAPGMRKIVKDSDLFLPPGVVDKEIDFKFRKEKDAWNASFRLVPHRPEEVMDIIIHFLQMTTVLNADGSSWNRARLRVQNQKRQFLGLRMPAGSRLVRLVVDGRLRRPAKRPDDADILLVPLPKGSQGDISFYIDVYYTKQLSPLGNLQGVSLQHPRVETVTGSSAKVQKIYWTLRAPREFTYYSLSDDMEEVGEEAVLQTRLGQAILKEFNEVRQVAESEKTPEQVKEKLLLGLAKIQTQAFQENERARELQQDAESQGKQSTQLAANRRALGRNFQELESNMGTLKEGQRVLEGQIAQQNRAQERLFNFRGNVRKFKAQRDTADRAAVPDFARPEKKDFGEDLNLKRPAGERQQIRPNEGLPGYIEREIVEPRSADIHLPLGPEYVTRCFFKEGADADLSFSVIRRSMGRHVGVLLKLAGFSLLIWVVWALGLLRIRPEKGLARAWLWPVVLVVAGAALASPFFAILLALGCSLVLWVHYYRKKRTAREGV